REAGYQTCDLSLCRPVNRKGIKERAAHALFCEPIDCSAGRFDLGRQQNMNVWGRGTRIDFFDEPSRSSQSTVRTSVDPIEDDEEGLGGGTEDGGKGLA